MSQMASILFISFPPFLHVEGLARHQFKPEAKSRGINGEISLELVTLCTSKYGIKNKTQKPGKTYGRAYDILSKYLIGGHRRVHVRSEGGWSNDPVWGNAVRSGVEPGGEVVYKLVR